MPLINILKIQTIQDIPIDVHKRIEEDGILPGTDQYGNPLTVGAYYYGELGFSVSVIPNINMHNMQYAFGNTATNSEDFKSSISGKYISNVYNSEGDEIN